MTKTMAPCPFCNRPNAVKVQQQELYTQGAPNGKVSVLTEAGFDALARYGEMTDRIEELIAENDRLRNPEIARDSSRVARAIGLLEQFRDGRISSLQSTHESVLGCRAQLESERDIFGYAIDALRTLPSAPVEPAGNPLPPEILADALQDKIHEDTGAVRAARSVKSRAGDPVEESGPDDPPTRY